MMLLLISLLFSGWAQAMLHHLFVGDIDGTSLYALEMDDTARTISLIKQSSAAGASPSIVFDRSKVYLFGSRPSDGTVSRYAVATDLSLQHEGTMNIPQLCNTTQFTSIKLSTGPSWPYWIYGSATTGNCSALFSTSSSGFYTIRSKEIAGDIRSLAWSPSGQHLYALDFKANTVLNFNIPEEPSLEELIDTALLSDVTTPRQMTAHPKAQRIYVVTQDSNELLDIPLLVNDQIDANMTATRHAVLPSYLNNSDFTTQSLAVSFTNTTLWTISRSYGMTVVSAFDLHPETGEVTKPIARASWTDYSGSVDTLIAAAPFAGDIIAVTNSPMGMVAVIGLKDGRIMSYGRVDLGNDPGCCGEGAWLN
ncbi:hypothetical protein CC78DRAFT_620207 [Lojkania enalia]|uniref:Uncharacterized protein n=1 Tax=Lojkania enalia TaxID=147567 RepID=A0A9P4K6S4_9PLEO|nr:hypothetical protein CC78DRAFT_620207 [Didymosphaeria enalia]